MQSLGSASLGRRPPPPPPPETSLHLDEDEFVSVDNLSLSFVKSLFDQADLDRDGRVADDEARAFFLRSGLSPTELSTVWRVVKPPTAVAQQGKGLSRRRFSQALRLIAMAQNGMPLTLATAALTPETWEAQGHAPLPPPTFSEEQTAFSNDSASKVQSQNSSLIDIDQENTSYGGRTDVSTGLEFLGLGCESTGRQQQQQQENDVDDDIFNLKSLSKRSELVAFTQTDTTSIPAVDVSLPNYDDGSKSRSSFEQHRKPTLIHSRYLESKGRSFVKNYISPTSDSPLAYEVRYPPLNPKESAKLTMLAAVNSCLFSGPSVEGGLLQWSITSDGDAVEPGTTHPESSYTMSSNKFLSRATDQRSIQGVSNGEGSHPVPTEDPDAAYCRQVLASPKGRSVTCIITDDIHSILWVGDRDGWVAGFDVGGSPGSAFDPAQSKLYCWQAHRVGSVSSLCLTPSGELWTGSSRGSIRVWKVRGTGSSTVSLSPSSKPRELRRSYGERAHNGSIVSMVCSADGQLVWSASKRGIVLWDALTGAFLGAIHKDSNNNSFISLPANIPGAVVSGGMSTINSISQATGLADDLLTNHASSVHADTSGGKISCNKGLKIDPVTGTVLGRPNPSEKYRWIAQQESWASQSDRGVSEFAERISEGAGKAVKLMGKLGVKLGVIGSGNNSVGNSASNNREYKESSALTGSGSSFGSEANLFSQEGVIQNSIRDGNESLSSGDSYLIQQNNSSSVSSVGDVVALVAFPDNCIWVGYRYGLLERYNANGVLEQSRQVGNTGRIYTMQCIGQRLWVGFINGMLSILSADGTVLKTFLGHNTGVVSITQAGNKTFTLAADGSISGWNSSIPSPSDEHARKAWVGEAESTYVRQSIHVLAVTWNCGESRPESGSSIFRWIHEHGVDKSLAVVGLQEVEMGGTSVALAAAKNALASRLQEKGNANAQFWSSSILNALGGDRHWHQIGLRQLSGMLVIAFARNNLRGHIGEVATASVACGVLGVGGNKGAVAVEFTLHRQKFAVVCSHFSAHQNAVKARNANYALIAKQLTFIQRGWLPDDDEELFLGAKNVGGRDISSSSRIMDVNNSESEEDVGDNGDEDQMLVTTTEQPSITPLSPPPSITDGLALHGEGLRSASVLIWLGDFNYRIEGRYDQVKELALLGDFAPLWQCDQLQREMAAGRAFCGLREAKINFPPTYKFDKGVASPAAYDSSEKRRIPAWCDRIFFRGSIPFSTPFFDDKEEEDQRMIGEILPGEIRVRPKEYGSWGDVYDSDHRPVYATLEVSLPVTDAAKKRDLVAKVVKRFASPELVLGSTEAPEVSIAPATVKVHPIHVPDQIVVFSNTGVCTVSYTILFGDDFGSQPTAGTPLEIRPARGMIEAGSEIEIKIKALPGGAGVYESGPREVHVQVVLGPEYGQGGAMEAGRGRREIEFTCILLPEFSLPQDFNS